MTICIAILTYKRPEAVTKTLQSIMASDCTALNGTIIQVIDNDPESPSAEQVIKEFQSSFSIPIYYTHEPKRGIANARNRAMDEVFKHHGYDYLAFIDDDEIVEPDWLEHLQSYQFKHQCDVVMGNVIFQLPNTAPSHIKQSSYFNRSRPKSGSRIKTAFTGNVLISRALYDTGLRFDTRFNLSGGEDHHFFSQAHAMGFKMVYCGESIAHSPVSEDRLTAKWLLKRAEISAMAGAVSDKIIMKTPAAIIKNLGHSAYRLGLGMGQLIALPFKKSSHWSHAARHIMMAKGRLCGLLKTDIDDFY